VTRPSPVQPIVPWRVRSPNNSFPETLMRSGTLSGPH
jgi:hypothetical protein